MIRGFRAKGALSAVPQLYRQLAQPFYSVPTIDQRGYIWRLGLHRRRQSQLLLVPRNQYYLQLNQLWLSRYPRNVPHCPAQLSLWRRLSTFIAAVREPAALVAWLQQ
jgi:hypothetical protein